MRVTASPTGPKPYRECLLQEEAMIAAKAAKPLIVMNLELPAERKLEVFLCERPDGMVSTFAK
jgi:hypothetical protein